MTWSGGETTEPTDGWYVEFTGTGDGGWTSGPVPTDDGEASYTRTSPVAQTETITARIANAGCTGTTSNPVTHEWWRGEIVITNPNVSSRHQHRLHPDRSSAAKWSARGGRGYP